MLEAPGPFKWVHKRSGLSFASWQIICLELIPGTSGNSIFGFVIAFFSNSVERNAEGVG